MAGFELEFVDWLKTRGIGPAAAVGIGDDMAVVESAGGRVLLSSDMLLEGVHFDLDVDDLARVGRKALACGLSDCAAMAVRPIAATVSLALPDGFDLQQAQRIYEGIEEMATLYEVAIVGGDTTAWPRGLAIDVTVIAEPYPAVEPVLRSGGRRGDRLYVTGPLGGSRLGHHLSFNPRVSEARRVAEQLGDRLHAMLDVSDGLALDLHRLCESSGVGAVIHEEELERVISDAAKEASRKDGRSALEHALSDGEDFELLMAVEGGVHDVDVPLFGLGELTEAGVLLRHRNATTSPLEKKGFVH